MRNEIPFVDFVGVGLNATDTVIQLPRFPEMGAKVEIASQQILLGGQVGSAAIACRRWGWRTRYVGKIGDDEAGRAQRASFADAGIESHLLEVKDCPSQTSYILVDGISGERTVLWNRDPRLDLTPAELCRDWIVNARLLHVDGHPSAPATHAARWAREAGVIVTADLDNLYGGVEELLQYVDYAITSREFPQRLTGMDNLPKALLNISQEFGCRVVGATLGRDGVLAWDGVVFHYCPGFEVAAVDTTGAGDIFHAGLAHALLDSRPLDYGLEFGCAAAALNCTAFGARGGIGPLAQVKKLLETGRRHPPVFHAQELQDIASSNRFA